MVWLYQLSRPENAAAKLLDFNLRAWQFTLGIWMESAALCYLGLEPSPPRQGATEDKRFAVPEWHSNPIYRTLKELYLLASDWLLKRGQIEGMDEAERQRLNFHLRQFVDAMSPALCLVSNPAALRRAMETGGASLAEGWRNLLNDLKEGVSASST